MFVSYTPFQKNPLDSIFGKHHPRPPFPIVIPRVYVVIPYRKFLITLIRVHQHVKIRLIFRTTVSHFVEQTDPG